MRKVGNVSKHGPEIIVHTLLIDSHENSENANGKSRRKVDVRKLAEAVNTLLAHYKCCIYICPRFTKEVHCLY